MVYDVCCVPRERNAWTGDAFIVESTVTSKRRYVTLNLLSFCAPLH